MDVLHRQDGLLAQVNLTLPMNGTWSTNKDTFIEKNAWKPGNSLTFILLCPCYVLLRYFLNTSHEELYLISEVFLVGNVIPINKAISSRELGNETYGSRGIVSRRLKSCERNLFNPKRKWHLSGMDVKQCIFILSIE